MDTSILKAVATIRDAVAYAEVTRSPFFVVKIDLQVAFDNLSHEYIFKVLCKYGFSERFRQRLKNIYNNATSSVQVNGYRSRPFTIKSSIRQGCPLSMLLFIMCLNPLLRTLEASLQGMRIGRHHTRTAVVAYTDDVTILMTDPSDIPKLQQAIQCFEAASGARVNFQKSRAIAIGTWDTSHTVMNIPYHDTAIILGFKIKSAVRESVLASWKKTIAIIQTQAQENYCRTMTLDMRIKYVHEYLMARAWYIAQIYPQPETYVRQINTIISWFIWKGDIFRVPLSTLYRHKEQRGWDFINFSAKSQALFLYRVRQNMLKRRTITWAWLRTWGLNAKGINPPFRDVIPEGLGYLRCFAMDSAYIEEQRTVNSKDGYKRRVYNILYIMKRRETGMREMRIVKLWPTTAGPLHGETNTARQ
jgi:hypothetical protein